MNINDKVVTINSMLRKSKLDLPEYRKVVTPSGKNVTWLLKNITKKNNNVPESLIDLLKNF